MNPGFNDIQQPLVPEMKRAEFQALPMAEIARLNNLLAEIKKTEDILKSKLEEINRSTNTAAGHFCLDAGAALIFYAVYTGFHPSSANIGGVIAFACGYILVLLLLGYCCQSRESGSFTQQEIESLRQTANNLQLNFPEVNGKVKIDILLTALASKKDEINETLKAANGSPAQVFSLGIQQKGASAFTIFS